jgi:hypothetical protein
MKKHRLAKPNEKIKRISRRPAANLCEQYAELLRLRDEIRRLVASTTEASQPDPS